jgi:4-amino-4-deoxy-L-arabinose transferase-like glycosyltransferase
MELSANLTEQQKDKFIFIFLTALTCLAALFRLNHIGWSNLWIDEAWTAYAVQFDWLTIMFLDVHPPINYWLVKVAVYFLGTSEAAIRSVSFVFSVIAIPLVYWFGKEATGKDLPGLIAAVLMTVSVEQIMQAQNARMYPIVLVVFMLMVIFFFRAYRTDKPVYWYLASACAIIGLWTWYFFIIPLGITVIWYLLRVGRKVLDNKPLIRGAIAFVFMGCLLSLSFVVGWSLKLTENNNLVYKGLDVIYQTALSHLGSPIILAVFVAIFVAFGGILLFLKDEDVAGYFGLLIPGSLTVGALVSYLIMMLPRYFIFLAPVFYTLIGYLVYCVYTRIKPVKIGTGYAVFVMLVVIGIFALPLPIHYATQHNYSGDWNDHSYAFSKIKGNATEVALVGNPAYVLMFDYYLYDDTLNVTRFDQLSEVVDLIKGKPSLVLIPDWPIPSDQPEARVIYDWLQDHGTKKTTYRGFEVYEVMP